MIMELMNTQEILQSPERWDERLLGLTLAHPYQSAGFAKCMADGGWLPQFLRLSEDSQVIGYCLYFVSPGKRVRGYWGPVLNPGFKISLPDLQKRMMDFFRAQGYSGIESFSTAVTYSASAPEPLTQAGVFTSAETLVVDVEDSIATQFQKMDHAVRKNIRKCADAGVSVEFRSDPEAIAIYFEMLKVHRRHLGERMPDFYPTLKSVQSFQGAHSKMEIALASIHGKPLSGMGFLIYGKVMTEIAVAQSQYYFEAKLPAQDFIKIRAIERYAKEGVAYYDLAGIAVSPQDEKEANIKRFKLKFSKNSRAFSQIHRKPFRPTLYWASVILEKSRQRAREGRLGKYLGVLLGGSA